MIRKYKNFIYVFAIIAFTAMSIGVTYSYFNYSKEIVVADLSAGSIGIDFVGNKKTITSNDITSRTIGEGKVSSGLDFEIEAIADTEEILYELEISQTGLTPTDLEHVRIYLTDQDDVEVLGVYSYSELINGKQNNSKEIHQRIVEGNLDGTAKTSTYEYRLRIWIDKDYELLTNGNYQFDIYLYAVNVNKEDYHKLTFDSKDNRGNYTFKYVKTDDTYGDFPNITGVASWLKGEDEVTSETTFTGSSDITLTAEWELTPFNIMRSQADTTKLINFANISSDTNGKGIYLLPGTESDEYPIYYYRGAVTNNNVIFGDFCWLMVRTTDTGGIKMIYNGVVTGTNENPTCENALGTARQLATTSKFNTNAMSMSDVGYMYNERYAYTSGAATSGAYFGTEIEYDDTNNLYNLKAGTTSTTKDATHHYTCNLTNANGTCASIRYYYYNNYYITLTGGDFIEDALYKMTGNGTTATKTKNAGYVLNNTDSTAKTNIEAWFKTNLTNEEDASKTNYQEYLEDTIFCNDRKYQQSGNYTLTLSGWNPNGGDISTSLSFNTYTRYYNNNWYSTTNVPSMTCQNETDSFRVGNNSAKLNYPVGLLTVDEVIMAGASGNSNTPNNNYYLRSNTFYRLISPTSYAIYAFGSIVGADGSLNQKQYAPGAGDYASVTHVHKDHGLRPVVSLKLGTEFETGGNGTPTNPYVVKYE